MRPLSIAFAAVLVVQTFATAPAVHAASNDKTPANACSVDQRAAVSDAFARAEERLRASIAFIEQNPDHAHVARYFGTAPRKIVRRNLQLILTAVASPRRAPIHCDTGPECETAFAYTDGVSISFCPRFFASPAEGKDAQFGVVVHEVSHIAVKTRDAAYQPDDAAQLAAAEPAIAAMNADNYEYFVEFLPK